MTNRKKSIERAMGDRILELSKGGECAVDAFFHRLTTLKDSRIDEEHEYLISAVQSAAKEIGVHRRLAASVLRHIRAEKNRCAQNCQDVVTGRRFGPVHMHSGARAE